MCRLIMILFCIPILAGCSTQKKLLTDNDLSSDEILIIGLIESDYSQLEHKNIKGIELFIDSDQPYSDFSISEKYLPNDYFKSYKIISIKGNKGEYKLFYKSYSETPDADRLLTKMNQDRPDNYANKQSLLKYSVNDGKILCIGKLTVKYHGGNVETGSVKYSYSLKMDDTDTIALHSFKRTYPSIYSKHKNDIYIFKNDYQKSLNYVLTNLSEGKRLFINSLLENEPDKISVFFNDLSPLSQKKYIKLIEESTFDQLNDMMNSKIKK